MYKGCEWLPHILQLIAKERDFSPEKFSCSICSQVLQDPATIPCGHTFCAACVTSHWDGQDGRRRPHTCPQCRQEFSPRPILVRNTTLEDEMKGPRDKWAEFVYAEPGDVACDVCPRKKRKAISTCLGCRIAFCESHLRDYHTGKEQYKTHKLVKPGLKLHDDVCPVHHLYVTMYCCTDHQVVCPTCADRQHQGHQIISATAEMKRRKAVMVSEKESIEAQLQHHKKVRKDIEKIIGDMISCAEQEITLRSTRFLGLIQLMQWRQYEVEDEVKAHKRSLQKFEDNLEQELSELKRQQAELNSLSLTQDPAQFLQKFEQLSELKEQPQSVSDQMPLCFIKELTEALSDIPHRLQSCTNMGLALTQNPLLLQQPITREQYLKYAINITLDPNTAHKRLVLSEENRKVTVAKEEQDYPNHPERFNQLLQALNHQELTGRCYFEVQWLKQPKFLGFTYKKIGRKGKREECVLGMNDMSWALHFDSSKTSLWHNGEELEMMTFYNIDRVGVYLDHTAGNISFYAVDKEMCQLAKLQTLFKKPLYVAARFTETQNSLEFLKLK